MSYRYQKLIKIPYHTSTAHPRMPLTERAAIFLPFAALSGFDDEVAEVHQKHLQSYEVPDDLRQE